jgi:hypothetical protein
MQSLLQSSQPPQDERFGSVSCMTLCMMAGLCQLLPPCLTLDKVLSCLQYIICADFLAMMQELCMPVTWLKCNMQDLKWQNDVSAQHLINAGLKKQRCKLLFRVKSDHTLDPSYWFTQPCQHILKTTISKSLVTTLTCWLRCCRVCILLPAVQSPGNSRSFPELPWRLHHHRPVWQTIVSLGVHVSGVGLPSSSSNSASCTALGHHQQRQ